MLFGVKLSHESGAASLYGTNDWVRGHPE